MPHDIATSEKPARYKAAIIGAIFRSLETYNYKPIRSKEKILQCAREILVAVYGKPSLRHPNGVEFEGIFQHVFECSNRNLDDGDLAYTTFAAKFWSIRDRDDQMTLLEKYFDEISQDEFQRLFGAGEETPEDAERLHSHEARMAQYAFSSALYAATSDYPDSFVDDAGMLEKASELVLEKFSQDHFEAAAMLSYLPFRETFMEVFKTFYELFRWYLRENIYDFTDMVTIVKEAPSPYQGIKGALTWMRSMANRKSAWNRVKFSQERARMR